MTTETKSWLTVARDKLKKTQADIARELKIEQAAVSHWEHRGAVPRPNTWADVAVAYGVPYRELRKRFMAVLETRGTGS